MIRAIVHILVIVAAAVSISCDRSQPGASTDRPMWFAPAELHVQCENEQAHGQAGRGGERWALREAIGVSLGFAWHALAISEALGGWHALCQQVSETRHVSPGRPGEMFVKVSFRRLDPWDNLPRYAMLISTS